MLSFEISAVDIVLLVAMLVLLALFATRRNNQSLAESQLGITRQERLSEKTEAREETLTENRLDKQPMDGFRGCAHQFGHLRSMLEGSAVPDECHGCPKVLRCMFKNE